MNADDSMSTTEQLLGDPTVDARPRLAKKCIGRPRASDEVLDVVLIQYLAQDSNAEGIGVDDATRRGVMKAGSLVTQGRSHDHDVTEVEVVDQRACAAAGDERAHPSDAISSTKPAANGAPTPGWITETGPRR